MYFDHATMTISEFGNGDKGLEGEEYSRSDRRNRIKYATDSLCDFVHEHILAARGEEIRFKHFTPADLEMIAHMIAVGMMAQFEHDLAAECSLMADFDFAKAAAES